MRLRLASVALVLLGAPRAAAPQPPKRAFALEALAPEFWQIVPRDGRLDVAGTGFGFTEGPLWDSAGFLYVSDETLNEIFRLYPGGRRDSLIALGDPDGNTFDGQHRLIDCASVLRALIAITPDGHYTVVADRYEGKRFNSPNDVVLGPDHALYFTDPTLDLPRGQPQELPYEGVYRLGRHGAVTLLTKELRQPNGLAFSPDGRRLYIDDSELRNIRAYDVGRDGQLHGGRVLGTEPGVPGDGVPDGMKVDAAGHLFVTGPRGIWVWDASGHHLGTIVVPEQPANLAWGDADRRTLYITAQTSVYKLRLLVHGAG